MPKIPAPQTVSSDGAAWSQPDGVFADLFPGVGPDGPASGRHCPCPDCQADDDETSLPVVRPVSAEDLVAAAAASALVGRACALADWLGTGRPLTSAKVLRFADAVTAVAELGLDRPVLPVDGVDAAVDPLPFGSAAGGRGPRARSAKHLLSLHPLWSGAVAAGLIEVRGQKAVPGPALAFWPRPAAPGTAVTEPAPEGTVAAAATSDAPATSGRPTGVDERLDCWARLVAGYLRAHAEREQADELRFPGPRQLLVPASAVLLYTAGDAPLTPAILAVGSLAGVEDELNPMALLTLPEQIARWTHVLQMWAAVGVVTKLVRIPGDPGSDGVDLAVAATHELAQELEPLIQQMGQALPGAGLFLGSLPDALRQGPVVAVTPSGRDLLARLLRGQGLNVPTIGDLVDTRPEELLLALSEHDPLTAADELRIWLDARGQDWAAAVDDLVASASGKDGEAPLRRAILPVVIGLLSQAAGSMVEQWRQDPWLAVPIALGLAVASPTAQPEPAHLLWMGVDLLSAGLDDDDAFADLVDVTGIADVLGAPGAIDVAVGLDHPDTREVLRLLVDHLDDRTLAKQLRRALTGATPTRTPQTRPSATQLPGL